MKNQSTFAELEQSFSTWLSKRHSTCPEEHFALNFLNKFFVISGIVSKNSQQGCQNCFFRACKKTLGEKSFEKRSQLKELCFWLWPKNVQSLVKTALYVSKGILSPSTEKLIISWNFSGFWAKSYGNQRIFFLKNSQNWIVRAQRKVYPGESILKVRENTEHFLDFEPNLFVTVVRTAIHASRKKLREKVVSRKKSYENEIIADFWRTLRYGCQVCILHVQ